MFVLLQEREKVGEKVGGGMSEPQGQQQVAVGRKEGTSYGSSKHMY